MRAKHAKNNDNKKPERNGIFAGFGARIVRSLFFWGLAAILASSAYTGIVRIARDRPRSGSVETAETDGQDAEKAGAAILTGLHAEKDDTVAVQNTESVMTAAAVGRMDSAPTSDPNPEALPDSGERSRVALTFDDGPHPVYTEELLDGLKERGVKATFFVVGENIPGNEELIRRMDEEGHLIGNHTYNHVKISDMSKADACEQIEKTSALIRELTGKDTEFVRPPFGEWNKELECSFVMIPVLWDVDPKDWTTRNVSDIVRRVLEDTENGDIILLHDYYRSSVQAALQIVDTLQGQGYEFVTVDELILE